MESIYLTVPRNLFVEQLLKEEEYDFPRREIESMYFLCHSLVMASAASKEAFEADAMPYIPLWSKILQPIVRYYDKYFELLQILGVLECDNRFVRGEKCKGYRFTKEYTGTGFQKIEVSDRRLKTAISKQREISERRPHGYGHLFKWFDTGKLRIDSELASEYIENLIQWSNNKNEKRHQAKKLAQEKFGIPDSKKYKNNYSLNSFLSFANVEMITDKHRCHLYGIMAEKFFPPFNFNVDKTSQRVHTRLVRLKRELRSFVKYDGLTLSSVDLKNSQPYFLIALCQPEFWSDRVGGEVSLKGINKEKWKEMKREKEKYNTIITLANHLQTQAQSASELSKFLSLVSDSGDLYSFLQQEFNSMGGKSFSRDEVKIIVLKILYHNPFQFDKDFPPLKRFQELFPTIYSLIQAVKAYGYKTIAILLQRVESFVITQRICKKIAQQQPKIPLFTIHDSIVSTIGNELYIKSVMDEELLRITGIKPGLKVEHWNKPPQKPEYVFNNFLDGFVYMFFPED